MEMPNKFFPRLSQNYIDVLNDEQHYDITIEVGKDQNIRTFGAHTIILFHRSPFLQQTLSSIEKNNGGDLPNIKLSNITPDSFQIILK